MTQAPKSWHDMGGDPAGPMAFDQHDFTLSEKRVDALMLLATQAGHLTVDELRRGLEEMGEQAFETMTYYERWIASVNRALIDHGVYSVEELSAKMEAVARRGGTYGEASLG